MLPTDMDVVIEPRFVSVDELPQYFEFELSNPFETLMVNRTVTTWRVDEGPMLVQMANPSSSGIRIPSGLIIGFASVTQFKTPSELGTSVVAAAPSTPEKETVIREELRAALRSAFKYALLVVEQVEDMATLCVKQRSVFALSPGELGRCMMFEPMPPLKPRTRSVDEPLYRTSTLVKGKINAQVVKLVQLWLIEERSSTWRRHVTIVAKPTGSPRFCVDHRHTLNPALKRNPWPLPRLYDFVTQDRKSLWKVLPFGLMMSVWLLQRMISRALENVGHAHELLCSQDDLIC